jgi:GT2 family glycosyltransferase
MTINIIHLPHRTDRLKILKKELQSNNISDYQLWPGILNKFNTHTGISQAHKQIVKYASEKGLKNILIAEDDLRFTSPNSFQYFQNSIPKEYDLFLASVYHGQLSNENLVSRFSGLTFYSVNHHFYAKFLDLPENVHLDIALSGLGKYVVCNPFTVIQHNGYSDNSKQNCNYDIYMRNRKLYEL